MAKHRGVSQLALNGNSKQSVAKSQQPLLEDRNFSESSLDHSEEKTIDLLCMAPYLSAPWVKFPPYRKGR